MRIIVDGDACPRSVRRILQGLRPEYGYELITVASFNHNLGGSADQHVIVGDGPDAADLAVVKLVQRGDIVVTQDWGLAALVLAKGGHALSTNGYVHTAERIDFLLAERHIKAKHRRAGGRTKGPRARTNEDDDRFAAALRTLLAEAKL